MNSVAYITHPAFLQHEMGQHHPESPARLHAISDQLIAAGIEPFLLHRDAMQATREQIERVHEPAYVDEVFEAAPQEGLVWLDGDTAMNPHSLEAALHAAGANVQAVDMVMAGEARRAFCAVRPPGHHAGRDRAMGFCIFNNIAVGAAHAITVHGLERVAIVDFDVHHGNGTEDIFSGDNRVLMCSTF
ncbi:MAG: histone deacetylase family protein, partial [Chromatiales bacterium]